MDEDEKVTQHLGVNALDLENRSDASDLEKIREESLATIEADAAKPTFGEALGASIELDWLGSSLYRAIQDTPETSPESLRAQEEFELTEGLITQTANAYEIPEQYWTSFAQAQSEPHLRAIASRVKGQMKLEEDLAALGWSGVGLRVLTSILDPVALVAEGAALTKAGKAVSGLSRGRRALLTGAATAATAGAVEATIVANTDVREEQEILYAMAFAGLIGSAFGSLGKTFPPEDVGKAQDIYADMADTFNPASSSVGAAQAPGSISPLSQSAKDALNEASRIDPPKTVHAKIRHSFASILGGSENPLVRSLAGMTEDAVGKEGDAITMYSASEFATKEVRSSTTRILRTAEPLRKQWAEKQGYRFWEKNRQTPRSAFYTEVGRAIKDPNYTNDPNILKAAGVFKDEFKKALAILKNPRVREGIEWNGVKGFKDVQFNDTYFPRMPDLKKVDRLVQRYGDDQIASLISKALRKSTDDLSDELIEQIGRGYLRTLRKLSVGSRTSFYRGLGLDQAEDLKKVLTDELSNEIEPEVIDRVAGMIVDGGDGVISRAKKRLQFDENFSETLRPLDGTGASEVRVSDLFNEDAEHVFNQYIRQTMGHAGMARLGIHSRGDLAKKIEDIRATSKDVPGYTDADLKRDVDLIETLYDIVTGRPITDLSTRTNQAFDRIKAYNFIRVMGQVGFAQLAELGNLFAPSMWKAMGSNMPALGAIVKRAKTGQLDDDVLKTIEEWLGFGSHVIRGNVFRRFHEVDLDTAQRAFSNTDELLEQGKQVVAKYSGLGPLTDTMQLLAARSMLQKMTNLSYAGKQLFTPRRRAQLGLTDDMWERIQGQIKKHTVTERGPLTGQKLKRLNLEDWDDPTAREAMLNVVDRHTKKVIQENDIGNLAPIMTQPLAQVVLQFRTFMLVAYEKQLLHGLNMRDIDAFGSFALSMMFGGLAYTAQTYAKSVGRSDREEYLEDSLSPKRIAAAAFQRSAYASWLPTAIDTGMNMAGQDLLFNHGRTSGLSSMGLLQNPSFDLVDRSTGGVQNLIRSGLDPDYDLSQNDLRRLSGILPFQNMLGVQNGLNALIGATGLPEYPQ